MSSGCISLQALDVLRKSTVDGCNVKLPRQLEPSLYEEVNEVLTRCGGKYKMRGKLHEFPYDPTGLLAGVIGSGEMPPKNPLAFFPTPDEVAWEMVGLIFVDREDWVRTLEPSAGLGAIANVLCEETGSTPADMNIDLVEIDPFRASILRGQGYKNVYEMDFLDYKPELKYHQVYMNPPFAVAGNPLAYIDHVMHAYELLEEDMGSTIVSVVPPSYKTRTDKKCTEFREFLQGKSSTHDIPRGAFKTSGTMVSTEILIITKY